MTEFITFERLCGLLEENKNKRVLLTFHTVGDRDGVSSAVSLSNYFNDSIVMTPDFITSNARRMLEQSGYAKKIGASFPKDREVIIISDTMRYESLGKMEKLVRDFEGEVIFIDHHVSPQKMPAHNNIHVFNDERYSAAASIIYEALKRLDFKITRNMAIMLLNGIVADSADFQNATSRTFRQVSELLEIAEVGYSDILEYYHGHISVDNRYNTIKDILSSNTEIVGDYVIIYGQAGMHANVVADSAIKLGADASVFWSSGKNECTISARLLSPLDKKLSIHLGVVLRDIGKQLGGSGGGHPCAAGAYGPKKEALNQVSQQVVERIKQKLSGS